MSNIFKRHAERMRAHAEAAEVKEQAQIVYPFIREVCELFDITVMSDQEAVGTDENDFRSRPVYALGWHAEPGAGIRYGTMTGWFETINQLDEFCKRHIVRFREEAQKCEKGAPIPDASDWN